MRIGVDIDDCLVPWYGPAHDACVRAGITAGVTPKTWSPFEEYGCTDQDWYDALEVATLDGTLYDHPPFPGAVAALRALQAAGHTIHLVTARGFFVHGELIRRKTIEMLGDYAVPHNTLTFSSDKTIVRTDAFVDDHPKHIVALLEAGTPAYLVDAPHNQDAAGYRRVHDLVDFADQVLTWEHTE